jgi:CheY-like chemotaxis protein
MIERNVALEARLIDDLLDHTKIVNGKLTIRPQLCDAHSLIALVLEMVRGDAGQRQVAIHLDLAAGRSFLRGDPARLQQVFWNLLRNAVKFSRSGGAVSVRSYDSPRCTREDEDGSAICIEVMDQGVGFDPAVTEAIFRPFEQAASGHRFGGLGLGLAIARGIVEIHGGKIYGKSDGVGKGAAFTVELPAASRRVAEKAAPVTVEHPGKVESTGNMPPLRLLLVEDHEPTMHVITRLLTRGGHKIVAAGSVEEARAAAAREPFDLVISDLGLPDGTGVELMRHLRDAHGLRGIALSGYGTEEDLLQSGEAGFVEHLVKPIDFNDLRRALREFVAMRG